MTMHGMAVVTGDAGREAADIIHNAQQRHVPMLTAREAARRAGISVEGWNKVIKNGRGRTETVMAMARTVDVEEAVRRVLGLPPLRPAGQPHDALGEPAVTVLLDALADFERRIMTDPRLRPGERDAIIALHREAGGESILDEYRERLRRCRGS